MPLGVHSPPRLAVVIAVVPSGFEMKTFELQLDDDYLRASNASIFTAEEEKIKQTLSTLNLVSSVLLLLLLPETLSLKLRAYGRAQLSLCLLTWVAIAVRGGGSSVNSCNLAINLRGARTSSNTADLNRCWCREVQLSA